MKRYISVALLAVLVPADAAAVTSANITMQSLKLSADQGFVLSSDGGVVSAQAGPDSFGQQSSQSNPISGATVADANNGVGTAHAESSVPAIQFGPGTTVTLSGRINAMSSTNVSGNDVSQSIGTAAPAFEFQAIGASPANPIHVVFSMTMFGSIGGTADPSGTYSSEVTARFGYFANSVFVPVDSFDLTVAGPPDNPLLILDPVTINGTATLASSGVYVFEAFAQAQSDASDGISSVPEPLSMFLFGTGAALLLRRQRVGNIRGNCSD
jgi:hypothetical protein